MNRTTTDVTDRRAFLGRVTTGALITAATALPALPLGAEQPVTPEMPLAGTSPWDESWLGRITGKHRQIFDAMTPNDGFALLFAANFLNMYNEVEKLPDAQLTAVVGIRHFAAPMAFNDAIWQKYKLGEFFKITDPATKAPAVRNIFTYDDGMMFPNASVPKLQKRGVIFTMCNIALNVLSGMTATAAGVPTEGAAAEWNAGLLPGITLVPVGVMAINRAQEHKCTYCSGG
jgi:intracellular sulfur oxidation DsrE/DsrF family protein